MIKVIIFDFGGVVAGIKSEESGLFGLCKKFCKKLKIPAKKLLKIFHKRWDEWKVGKLTIDQVYDKFLHEIHSDYDKEKLIKITLHHSRLNKKVYNLVKKLKKDYKVVCLTNHAKEWFENEIKRFKLHTIFDEIFTSYDLKFAKPDKKVYKVVLKKLKVKPEQTLFIDDLKRNTKPAGKLGINTITFKSYSQLKRELINIDIKGV